MQGSAGLFHTYITYLNDKCLNKMCYYQGHKLKEVYNLNLDVELKILRFLQIIVTLFPY